MIPVDRKMLAAMSLEEVIAWTAALEAEFAIRLIEQRAEAPKEKKP